MPLSSICRVSPGRAGLLLVCLAAGSAPLAAQQRRTLSRGEPEAQIMGYYAALMSFLPVGLPDRDGRLTVGASATYMPSLSVEDRTVSFGGTKTVNTNFCTGFPRLTAAKGFGRFSVEAGATPGLEACGAKASVFAGALSYRGPLSAGWDGLLRLSGYGGTVEGAMTCSADMVANPNDQTCYGGSISADKVAPVAVAVTLNAAYRGWAAKRIEPYFTAGVRYERVDFDVNYTRTQAQATAISTADPAHQVPPLDDHERLRTTLSRIQLGGGASWYLGQHLRLGGELLYAPGAVFTMSGMLGYTFGRSR